MSESSTEGQSTTESTEANQQEGAGQASDTTDWKAEARKWEQRAKANTDAADKLQALEDAQKSEAQKQQDALAAATAERDQLRLDVMRRDAAARPVPLRWPHGSRVHRRGAGDGRRPGAADRCPPEESVSRSMTSAGKSGAATTPADAFARGHKFL